MQNIKKSVRSKQKALEFFISTQPQVIQDLTPRPHFLEVCQLEA